MVIQRIKKTAGPPYYYYANENMADIINISAKNGENRRIGVGFFQYSPRRILDDFRFNVNG